MRKMLLIAGAAALSVAGVGVLEAAQIDRSQLTFEENAIINLVCAPKSTQSTDAFRGCVAREIASLQKHPTPDRSALPSSRVRTIDNLCDHLRREGIAAFNDCWRKAIEGRTTEVASDEKVDEEMTPNYAKIFVEGEVERPPVIPIAAALRLPKPSEYLAERPEHLEKTPLAPAALFKKVEKSVFVVLASTSLAEARMRNLSQGSAVAITEHLLLTNCHVVKDRPIIRILQDQRSTKAEATLVASDNLTDRCVLEAKDITLVPIRGIRSLDSLSVGERVFAVGSPLSFERTLSEGLISGIRNEPARTLVQTSAPVGHGSSGGGLFDERGNLIGITTLAVFAGAQNLNFAIAAAEFFR